MREKCAGLVTNHGSRITMGPIDLRESWNRLSAYYQRRHAIRTESAHYGVLAPDEDRLRLLGDLAGKRILELGCGGGQCSIAFAGQGAECVGVDQSEEQIAYARSLAEQEDVVVEFRAEEMLAFLQGQPAGSYDIVFSAFALQYVEDLASVFREAFRVLKPGGLLVFSLDHPLSDVTEQENGKTMFRRSYFDRGREDWTWERIPFYSFHRTVGDFLNLLVDAGFIVERLLEPEPTDESDYWAEPQDYERYANVPATIIWKARKP